MFDQQKAIAFVQAHANAITEAKLAFILEGKLPVYAITRQIFEDQRPDGGFQPFWADDYSSLDATCYRLAQAESVGLNYTDASFSEALRFLLNQQQPSGRFNEDPRVAASAPPWVKPGDLAGDLYLTANAAFWLAQSPNLREAAQASARFIHKYLKTESGQLPTFLNGYWLAAALWWVLREQDTAVVVLNQLQTKLEEMDAANLIWLLNALRLVGVPRSQDPIPGALAKLAGMQAVDGRFPSAEGQEVHNTIEAIRLLKYYDN